MTDNIFELKEGIKAHLIKTDIFKTNLIAIILTTPLKRKNVTKNALIPFLLKRGSKNFPTHEQIALRSEELYGTSLNCGVDKVGDNQVIKFIAECVDNNYTLNGEDILKDVIDLLTDVVFNTYLENGKFKDTALDTEKVHLKELIDSKINSKDVYCFNKCLENMFEFTGYGLYKYGYTEDIEKITLDEISEYYFELIRSCKIDIYISGNFDEKHIEKVLCENSILQGLDERNPEYNIAVPSTETVKKVDSPKKIQEKMNISQGKLAIGCNIFDKQPNSRDIGIVFNCIFGEGANSMLFQNVREKSGLAYTVKASFIKPKNVLIINAGIESQNYEKALQIINEQIENVKAMKFTDKDLMNAKTYIVSGIKNIEAEQDTGVVFFMGQELSNSHFTIEEYIKSINSVTREEVAQFAKSIQTNTIYFLASAENN